MSFVPRHLSFVIRPLSFDIFPSSAVSCRLSVASCQQQASGQGSVVGGQWSVVRFAGVMGQQNVRGLGRMRSVIILGTCDLSSWASRGNHGFHVNAHLSKARLAYYLKIRNIQQVPPSTDPIKSASDGNALASQMRLAGLLILPRVEGNFHVRRRVGRLNGEKNRQRTGFSVNRVLGGHSNDSSPKRAMAGLVTRA